MPTYEYECQKCGHLFELFQSMSDPLRKRCPECRGAVKRLIGTGAGLLFKGSGFYTTDYRSDSYKKDAKSASSDSSSTSSSDTKSKEKKSKSESAPAKKSPKASSSKKKNK